MGEGFEVDLYALHQAADGIARSTEAVATRPLDTVGAGAAVGHERLAAAVADFLTRWQGGVEELCADGREIADRLRGAADAYTRSDENGRRMLDGILRADTGPDPAAGR